MRKIFAYSRKVRVPLDDRGFNSNEYNLFMSVEYDEKDLENLTIINKNEFNEMSEEIDKIQRQIIEEETGITELPMDISKRKIKLKTKISGLNKLKERLRNKRKE